MDIKINKDDILSGIKPENLQLVELVRSGKLTRSRVRDERRKTDLKKAGLLAAGVAGVISVAALAGHYVFYRSIASKELKKQLAPMTKELAALQEENRRLAGEVERLKAQDSPAEEAPAEVE